MSERRFTSDVCSDLTFFFFKPVKNAKVPLSDLIFLIGMVAF